MLTAIFIFFLIFWIGTHIGFYGIYEKAGEKGWKAFVPFYGALTRIKIVGRKPQYIIYFFIPIVNLFCWYYTIFDLLKSFGKTDFKHSIIAALFPFIYLPYLGFSSEEKYLGKASELPKIEKSTPREWTDAILFAIIASTLIRWSMIELYTIPTPSMENSLLVGDFLFVSKFHYGTRTPATPLQVPLTHQEVPLIGTKSYSDLISLPQYRLPGLQEVERNDVVVFNLPANVITQDGHDLKNLDRPVDLRTNYIKRGVGAPGDELKIIDSEVYINGEKAFTPPEMQFNYEVITTSILRDRVMNQYNISDYTLRGRSGDGKSFSYIIALTDEQRKSLENLNFIAKINQLKMQEGDNDPGIFVKGRNWNKDWFGPINVPEKGKTIPINEETLAEYGDIIRHHEMLENVIVEEGRLLINGEEQKEYTFNQNYYFMMGDNRDNSLDSRYWGYVPESHVVGKAFFIFLSLDKNKSLMGGKIRWDRFFQLIK